MVIGGDGQQHSYLWKPNKNIFLGRNKTHVVNDTHGIKFCTRGLEYMFSLVVIITDKRNDK